MTVDQILAWTDQLAVDLVEITGGEPLIHPGVHALISRLLGQGRQVLIETNGSRPLDPVSCRAAVIMDIKCPDSGMSGEMHWPNIDILGQRKGLGARDEIKFVLSSEADFHWARTIIEEKRLAGLVPLLFSPASPDMAPKRLAELILHHHLPVRLQLPLHRLLWPDQSRGV